MSDKEQTVKLLDKVPDYKMGYVLAYVQKITADEEADGLFCERMYQNCLNDPILKRIRPIQLRSV